MLRRPPRSTRADSLFPYTTLFRSNEFLYLDTIAGQNLGNLLLVGQLLKPCTPTASVCGRETEVLGAILVGHPHCLTDAVLTVERNVQCISTRNRSEEHTSELQSLLRISYAVFCLKKKQQQQN